MWGTSAGPALPRDGEGPLLRLCRVLGPITPALGIIVQRAFAGLLVGIPALCCKSRFHYTTAGDKD